MRGFHMRAGRAGGLNTDYRTCPTSVIPALSGWSVLRCKTWAQARVIVRETSLLRSKRTVPSAALALALALMDGQDLTRAVLAAGTA